MEILWQADQLSTTLGTDLNVMLILLEILFYVIGASKLNDAYQRPEVVSCRSEQLLIQC